MDEQDREEHPHGEFASDCGDEVLAALREAILKADVQRIPILGVQLEDINRLDQDGLTLLMLAVKSGRTDSLKSLLRLEPDLNARDASGLSALMWAVKTSNEDALKALIRAGADLEAKNQAGKTAENMAAEDQNMRLLAAFKAASRNAGQLPPAVPSQQGGAVQRPKPSAAGRLSGRPAPTLSLNWRALPSRYPRVFTYGTMAILALLCAGVVAGFQGVGPLRRPIENLFKNQREREARLLLSMGVKDLESLRDPKGKLPDTIRTGSLADAARWTYKPSTGGAYTLTLHLNGKDYAYSSREGKPSTEKGFGSFQSVSGKPSTKK